MVSVTKEQFDILISLQKIETRFARIRSVMDGVSEKVDSLRAELEAFEKSVEEKCGELEAMRERYRNLEFEVQENADRLKKSREHLKVVKTNKEYQVLLREIDDNEKRNSALEETMIEFLEKIEAEEKNCRSLEGELEQMREEKKQEISEIETKTERERKEMAEISAERAVMADQLGPALLDRFNKTLKNSGGLALVPAYNGVCGGCFMNIPPQLYIEVQKGGLNFCPQCHRMLYWEEQG